ncbi:prolyl oligopeptidase family serine peptidase [Chryseobacterium jejuense]|uniref:Poly(3-hydroxybutyrate) depolymerase n=1 Tax=Chryseobacterium jejuense TaxID=445960 RepID=A0A2X2VJI7_CHRJE|nr:prolyl oligopeptidase family serine peptidase [Chryseobacterium jejuense]SDI39125.1 Prolyl oligopeptidase family protein [Chryseobacterium jejuense]SQB26927.1 Poly(3-hydroxybutyrate) depolymerase [Chryseobacterium jejuense]
MKTVLLSCLLCFSNAFSQSYGALMKEAAANLQEKEYCAALSNFKDAFNLQSEIGLYDYVSAASAAANCNDTKTAIEWLKKGAKLGLGKSRNEVIFLQTNERFKNLSQNMEFKQLLGDLENKVTQIEKLKKQKTEEWNQEIIKNQITESISFNQAPSGFALYFTEPEGLKTPYIVFVPKGYKSSKPVKVIFFLHGGVNSLNDFYYQNPDVKKEPIFSVGDHFNAIIVYPFAKKDFGWMNQQKAFENIFTILNDVEKKYNVDKNKIYLGGMSNGGTATFWFASQKETPFKAFYAFAPNPVLNIGAIPFENITKDHPLYTISAKDDYVFGYDDVLKIYNQNKSKAKGWIFQTIENGSHEFIYKPEISKELLTNFFSEVLR